MLTGILIALLAITTASSLSIWRHKIPRDATKEGIDDYASVQAYDQVSHWWFFVLIRHFVLRRLKSLDLQGRLMDAGCGPGYLAISIARRYSHLDIFGVDLSKMMLDLAVKNKSLKGLKSSLTLLRADVERLPLEDNFLDATVSTLSLHHWAYPERVLEEFHRVLKPGGRMLIFDLRRDIPWILFLFVVIGQRLVVPRPIDRVNGGIGSIWSSYVPSELEGLLNSSPFKKWEVIKGWGWIYISGEK